MLSTFTLADNIIGFIIDGPYDEYAADKIQQEVNRKLEVYEKVNFYLEDNIKSDISLKAVMKTLAFKMKTTNKFQKVAVVTDRKWIQIIAYIEKVFLNAEIRIFPTQQRMEAIQWIST